MGCYYLSRPYIPSVGQAIKYVCEFKPTFRHEATKVYFHQQIPTLVIVCPLYQRVCPYLYTDHECVLFWGADPSVSPTRLFLWQH